MPLLYLKNNRMTKVRNNLMVTVSGGRSSGMVARHIQTSKKYAHFNKIYVFTNTGQERPETIDFLQQMVKHWNLPLVMLEGVYSMKPKVGIKHKIVTFETINMEGQPFIDAINHKGKLGNGCLPNQNAPYCSKDLKVKVARHYAKTVFGSPNFVTSIGFRKEDMPKRITKSELKDPKKVYPLLTDFDRYIGNLELNDWWAKQPFQLSIHGSLGNCELCWKKGRNNLIKNIRYGTRFLEFWKQKEIEYNNTLLRDRETFTELEKIASLPTTLEIPFPNEEPTDNCVCSF